MHCVLMCSVDQCMSAIGTVFLSSPGIGTFIDISAFVVISGAFWSGEMRGHSMTETLNMSPTLPFVLHYCHTNHANTAQGLNVKYFPILSIVLYRPAECRLSVCEIVKCSKYKIQL